MTTASRSELVGTAAALVRAHGGIVSTTWQDALLGVFARMPESAAKAVSADPRVAYVEENGFAQAATTQSNPPWGLNRIDQRNLPVDSSYVYNLTGAGVHAYVLDGGIRVTHQEFTQPTNRIGTGANFVNDGYNESATCDNHGTHVAGTIGGTTYGVAKGVTIHSVRVIKCDRTSTNDILISGFNWVAANRISPAVANLSLRQAGSTAVDDAVSGMIDAGVVAVVAAGNDGLLACSYSPARLPAAITVGATSQSDVKLGNSNYGTCVDVFAPGENIVSAGVTSDTATSTMSNTSTATPHVSGIVALYLSQVAPVQTSTVQDFIIKNATSNVVVNPGTGSPNRLVYSRWIKHWFWYNTENCYDLIDNSCYSQTWSPACPSRPVWMKSCTTTGSNCWSIYSSTYVEEYVCSGSN